MKTERDAQLDKRYEEIVAETKRLIEESTDPASKARLEQALREGESFNRLVDETRTNWKEFNSRMDEREESARRFGPILPWIIGFCVVVIYLTKRYLLA